MPIMGFLNIVKRLIKVSLSLKLETASLIADIPNIKTANPIRIAPVFLRLSFLALLIIKKPIRANKGVNDSGFNNLKIIAVPSISAVLKSHAVTVVPTFAPKIMLMVWPSCIMPEFTKPTSITVVADEDWIIAVTIKPSKKPTTFNILLSYKET